jgi:uncharacterized caspase-like protein
MIRRSAWWVCLLVGFSTAPASAAPTDRLFVLAVGINAYPGKNRLHFAVKDARDIADSFRQKGRGVFRQVEVKLLTDAQAHRQGILDGLEWLRREVTAQDLAIVFYSGHGARLPGTGFFLVPAGFQDTKPRQTMVSGAELKRAMTQIAGPAILMLDCCYSGAVMPAQPAPSTAPRPAAAGSKSSGTFFLCASRAREESAEGPKLRHGTFTQAVLRGLAGKADANKDGVITVGELERFVKERTRQLSNGEQHAVSFRGHLPPTTPLARPGGAR